jgi:DNA-binding response OmpR family regulator
VILDNRTQMAAALDFGPRLVHGWMTALVGAELGVRPERILDQGARELLVGNERKPLTVREFDVMRYLSEREDQIASRESLLEDVWGITYDGAGNVVDAVIRSLRLKLGPLSTSIETVRGVGYRFYRP